MAQSTNSDLLVTFSREDDPEQQARCRDADAALRAAMVFLIVQDGLRAGDRLTVDWAPRPNLIERGLG
jgi:hypothetical protein